MRKDVADHLHYATHTLYNHIILSNVVHVPFAELHKSFRITKACLHKNKLFLSSYFRGGHMYRTSEPIPNHSYCYTALNLSCMGMTTAYNSPWQDEKDKAVERGQSLPPKLATPGEPRKPDPTHKRERIWKIAFCFPTLCGVGPILWFP